MMLPKCVSYAELFSNNIKANWYAKTMDEYCKTNMCVSYM